MEKYRQMGLSEDEAKIHLKREKRAEKIEKERRIQIEAEAGFQIAIHKFWVGSKEANDWPEGINVSSKAPDEGAKVAKVIANCILKTSKG